MKTITILSTGDWQFISPNEFSAKSVVVCEADTDFSYDNGATSVILPAGCRMTMDLPMNSGIFVKGTATKKIYIYNNVSFIN